MASKISIIGAGSAVFSLSMVRDLCLTPSLRGSTISFMDIDQARLDAIHALCARYADELGSAPVLHKTTDRRESLQGADVVVNAALAAGHERLRAGWEVAQRHGYRWGGSLHVMHDEAFWINFYQLRLFDSLIADVLDVCPDAWYVQADDTLLAARVTDDAGTVLATLVNYACHPTTLAWDNRLLSPDFIGAMRAVLEQAFDAPALFLQGASGELGPRDGFVGDPAVADRNGRQLGYAAAATLEGVPPAGTRLVYSGSVASGANIGVWRSQPCDEDAVRRAALLQARVVHAKLRRKDVPTPVVGRTDARAVAVEEQEKTFRRQLIERVLGDAPVHRMPIWVWRLGDAALIAVPNEPYSLLQTELRRRMAGVPLLVLGVTNGCLGYLPPRAIYGSGRYQERQSPYAPGCFEQTTAVASSALEEVLRV